MNELPSKLIPILEHVIIKWNYEVMSVDEYQYQQLKVITSMQIC